MGWYERHIVPRLVDIMCANRRMTPLRERAIEGVRGTVVELGFGSGGNLPAYPPEVERVLAVDPSMLGRRLARKRLSASTIPVEFVGLDGARIELDDRSVDNAVSTWTLCTIPDAVGAVRELQRVVRPGGRLFFLEHGLSPEPAVARSQHRFDGIQQRLAGGCHLNRDITAIIEGGGLRPVRCDNFYIDGPRAWCYMYAGTALRT